MSRPLGRSRNSLSLIKDTDADDQNRPLCPPTAIHHVVNLDPERDYPSRSRSVSQLVLHLHPLIAILCLDVLLLPLPDHTSTCLTALTQADIQISSNLRRRSNHRNRIR